MKPPTLRGRLGRLLAFERAIDLNLLVTVTDRQGIILSANKKFCEVSQYTESELVGKNHSIVNSGYHGQAFFFDMWNLVLGGNTWKGEIKNKSKSGELYWVDAVIVPILNKQQYAMEFLSLGLLISSSRETEFTLTDAAFTVSHKIRQPLSNMQALVSLVLLEEMGIDDIKSMVAMVQAELDKIDLLTRQMVQDMHYYRTRHIVNDSQL